MSHSLLEMSDRQVKDPIFSERFGNSSEMEESYLSKIWFTESKPSYITASFNMFKLAVFSIFGLMMRRGLEIVNLLFIGSLGDSTFISGYGIASTTIGITTISLGVGMAGGVETLSSQAFGHKKNYLANCYYTRAQVILTVLFIPQAIIMYFITPILIALGQPEKSSEHAGT